MGTRAMKRASKEALKQIKKLVLSSKIDARKTTAMMVLFAKCDRIAAKFKVSLSNIQDIAKEQEEPAMEQLNSFFTKVRAILKKQILSSKLLEDLLESLLLANYHNTATQQYPISVFFTVEQGRVAYEKLLDEYKDWDAYWSLVRLNSRGRLSTVVLSDTWDVEKFYEHLKHLKAYTIKAL